jgi:hypothetical protein
MEGEIAQIIRRKGASASELAIDGDSVAVDPAAIDKAHVVQQHELIYRGHQLEVANVGQEVWLHDSDAHYNDDSPRRNIRNLVDCEASIETILASI